MPDGSRRAFLAALGSGAITAGLTKSAAAQDAPAEGCSSLDERRETLEDKQARLEELRSERAALEDRVGTLRATIGEAEAEWIAGHHEHDAETRARARVTGEQARESVVLLELETPTGWNTGTGWVVGSGLLVTNSHVVADWARVTGAHAWSLAGHRSPVRLLGRVETLAPDVALLGSTIDAPPLPTGDSATLEAGDPLLAIGHPGSFGNWVITLGAYKGRNPSTETELLTDVPSIQGSSGAPTLTLDGSVVGMVKAGAQQDGNADPPTPADPTVRTGPITPEATVLHDSIESIMNQVGRWT